MGLLIDNPALTTPDYDTMRAIEAMTKHAGGRPPKPPGKKFERRNITLPPHMLQWLLEQPEGISGAIQRLIADAMDAEQGEEIANGHDSSELREALRAAASER